MVNVTAPDFGDFHLDESEDTLVHDSSHRLEIVRAGWKVPLFDAFEKQGKKCDHALVVFGESDLTEAKNLGKFFKECDVINFTDAFYGRTKLSLHDGVSASGKIQAALAYVLLEGYDGVVLLNNLDEKSSLESIPLFTESLRSGWDHIQGSRYLPQAGASIKLSDNIFSRLVVRPFISYISQINSSDFNNPLRAYSRKLLLHPKISPFKREFQRRTLLIHLARRATELNLKMKEIPVNNSFSEKFSYKELKKLSYS